ncbi:MAG: isoprenyl transferase [Lachnospiraceae bacterium]|nr:isoprenyl transferase [Lachnospiraceae bacterium]
MNVPQHVAIILDGNGRWAKEQGKPRTYGHKQGALAVHRILEDADALGIKYLTVYAFSTENWKRPKAEVSALMQILKKELEDNVARSMKNNIRCRVIGDRGPLSKGILSAIDRLEGETKNNTGLQFTLAINYGSRDEITRATRLLAADAASGRISAEEITEEMIASRLDTKDIPDPDLLIRTMGDQRISNYLLWQCAYTELYFTDTAWPAFDRAALEKAIAAYAGRDRRFGGLKEKEED